MRLRSRNIPGGADDDWEAEAPQVGEPNFTEDVATPPSQTVEKAGLDWFFEQLLPIPYFHELLSKKDVMNLREVCHDWRVTIDKFLELANDTTEPDYTSYKSIIKSPSTLPFDHRRQEMYLTPCLNNSSSVAKFLEESKDHPRNPFLSRRAKFNFVFDAAISYWEGVSAMLDKYGDTLSTASFFYLEGTSVLDMLIALQWSLARTPRLTTLECSFNNFYGEEDWNSSQFNPELPPLENLRGLVIDMEGLAKPIYKLFANYFDQLVSLNARNSKDFMDWYDPELHSKFASLQHLAICVNHEKDLHKLLYLSIYLTCSLREIDIDSKVAKYLCPSVYLHSVLHFGNSLSAFKLQRSIHCCSPVEETLADLGFPYFNQLEFPQLKVISINIMECGFGHLDPLLKLSSRSLEFLGICVVDRSLCSIHGKSGPDFNKDNRGNNDEEMDVGEDKIQVHLEDMYRSNVWELFPNLQEMRVRKRGFWEGDPARPQERRYTRAVHMR